MNRKPSLLVVFLTVFIDLIGFGIVVPLVPIFSRHYGAGGFVIGHIIECPKHNGRFDFTTGQAKGAPACVNLKTYPVKVEAGKVFLNPGE